MNSTESGDTIPIADRILIRRNVLKTVAGEDAIDCRVLEWQTNAVVTGKIQIDANRVRHDRSKLRIVIALVANIEHLLAVHILFKEARRSPRMVRFSRLRYRGNVIDWKFVIGPGQVNSNLTNEFIKKLLGANKPPQDYL